MKDGSLPVDSIGIMVSNWCVECEEKTKAIYIAGGSSLCEKHFKEVRKLMSKMYEEPS